ncbi:AIPR family protein [Cetobacterium sp.]|uniref:AIPR family protein n=1 Tax=Cetobacterium sp. TaxID=2071632 RepID=UPI003AEF6BF3
MIITSKIKKEIELLEHPYSIQDTHFKEANGFMFFSLKSIFDFMEREEIENGIVDSSYRFEQHDYGIDALYIIGDGKNIESFEELENFNKNTKFEFHIFQFKKGKSIDAETILKLYEGIKKAFLENDIDHSLNSYMVDKFNELEKIRAKIIDDFIWKNVSVHVNLCYTGVSQNLKKDPILFPKFESIKAILNENCYENVYLNIYGGSELINKNQEPQKIESILSYENSFKYITEDKDGNKINGYVGIIKASEIASLVEKFSTQIFELNIRDYYPNNKINEKIKNTSCDEEEGKYLWSFNNGLTIIAKSVEELPNQKWKLDGIQIVNGCQTSNSIFNAGDKLNPDASLIVKIIETANQDLIYKITETTNAQTEIKVFSLRANESIHKHIETFFLDHDIYYERRINFYKNKYKSPIISIQKLSQIYYSIIEQKPSIARANPKKIFTENYDRVFEINHEKDFSFNLYLIPVLIYLKIEKLIRSYSRKSDVDMYKKGLMSYGKFHLSLLLLNKMLNWKISKKSLKEQSQNIITLLNNTDDTLIKEYFEECLEIFEKVTKKVAGTTKKEVIATTLKKADLDKALKEYKY